LNEGVILPRLAWSELPFEDWRQNGDWFLDNLVTNGPFALESWDRQQQIVLSRNDDYYLSERPLLDAIVFRIVPQKVSQVGHLLSGEAQFVDHVPASEAARISERHDLEVLTYWASQYNFICWNTTRELFADAEMRRALTMAIDRQALIDALWFGHARVATSPIPSSIWAHNSEIQPWPYDPRAARTIFEDRGWEDTDDDGLLDLEGRPLAFELITNTSSAVRVDAAVMIQEQLRRVGIRLEIQRLEFNTLIEISLAHDFDAMLSGWTIDTSLDLDYAFHSESIEDGYNFGGFSDPEVDRLLDEVRDLDTPEKQGRKLAEIQAILHQRQPYTFLWEPQRLTGTAIRLRDAQPNALDPFFGIDDWWLEPTR
jgi:peptide/nickel transport system substrate-binding protein